MMTGQTRSQHLLPTPEYCYDDKVWRRLKFTRSHSQMVETTVSFKKPLQTKKHKKDNRIQDRTPRLANLTGWTEADTLLTPDLNGMVWVEKPVPNRPLKQHSTCDKLYNNVQMPKQKRVTWGRVTFNEEEASATQV